MTSTTFTLADGERLTVTLTAEGVILDLYDPDGLVATEGMTADEWADWVRSRPALCRPDGLAVETTRGTGPSLHSPGPELIRTFAHHADAPWGDWVDHGGES